MVSIAGNFEQAKLDRLVARYFGKGRGGKGGPRQRASSS